MIKTAIDIVDMLYAEINGSPLDQAISGGLYKFTRPVGSNLEDVVINSVVVDAEVIQRGAFNVNIHVPPISVTIAGQQQLQPDTARIKFLSTLASPILERKWGDHYNYWTESQTVIFDEVTKDWFSNFRIRVKQHNTY